RSRRAGGPWWPSAGHGRRWGARWRHESRRKRSGVGGSGRAGGRPVCGPERGGGGRRVAGGARRRRGAAHGRPLPRGRAAARAAAAPGDVGCLTSGYPPGWTVAGQTRESTGELAGRLGDADPVPPWIGGELLAGTSAALRDLVCACERLDDELGDSGVFLAT